MILATTFARGANQLDPTLNQDTSLDSLREFLLQNVASYEQLDVLLWLVRAPGAFWSAKQVAEGVGLETDECRFALEALADRGLLRTSADGNFQYSLPSGEVRRVVDLLDATYREQRAIVAMMMSTNAMERLRTSAIRTFAEAFRLRGKK
jgi:hypothetical protein